MVAQDDHKYPVLKLSDSGDIIMIGIRYGAASSLITGTIIDGSTYTWDGSYTTLYNYGAVSSGIFPALTKMADGRLFVCFSSAGSPNYGSAYQILNQNDLSVIQDTTTLHPDSANCQSFSSELLSSGDVIVTYTKRVAPYPTRRLIFTGAVDVLFSTDVSEINGIKFATEDTPYLSKFISAISGITLKSISFDGVFSSAGSVIPVILSSVGSTNLSNNLIIGSGGGVYIESNTAQIINTILELKALHGSKRERDFCDVNNWSTARAGRERGYKNNIPHSNGALLDR